MRYSSSSPAGAAMCAVLLVGVAAGSTAATASPPARPGVQAGPMDEARQQEREAAAALERSGAAVRAAGLELVRVTAALPGARQKAAAARGALAGATAKARAAQLRAAEAERELLRAEDAVQQAAVKVEAGRRAAGATARGIYQRGGLEGLQAVLEARDPQQALRRSSLLRSVLQYRDATLDQLTDDRLALASSKASVAAEQRVAQAAQQEAAREADRAQRLDAAAEASARAVETLVLQRRAALTAAERLREQDRRDYAQAQAESRALAERIRAAAAAAKAREAKAAAAAKAREARAAAEDTRRKAAAGAGAPRAAPARPSRSRGRMSWPAEGRLTSPYGYRTHPIYGDRRMHTGIDIGSGMGVPIIAAEDGTVLFSAFTGGYGNLTVVEHAARGGRSVTTSYAHQSVSYVQEGQQVRRGQMIGRAGDSGNVTGPHLHFEVRLDGDPVDPMGYVER